MDSVADIETIRALLSAFANQDGTPVPVSILSLRRELTRRRLAPDTAQQIALLRRIGDIETIGGGFYLPIPAHVVLFGDWGLLISGLPAQEIARLYGIRVDMPGSARVVRDLSSLAQIPHRRPLDWLGTPRSTSEWVDAQLGTARFVDPYGWDTLEVYNVDRRIGSLGWTGAGIDIRRSQGVHLLRNPVGAGPRSYYLLRVGSAGVDGMSDLRLRGADIRRLQFGLRAKTGTSARFSFIGRDDDTLEVSAPFLPAEEARFLEAIGRVRDRSDGRGISAAVPAYARTAITESLLSLGLIEDSAYQ